MAEGVPSGGGPGPLLRALYRMPLRLFRAGLAGWEPLIGMRWILVATRGRRSGKRHEVLLDLIGEDEASGRYFVQAAYGRNADWVRNIEATGAFEAQVGRDRFPAVLTTLPAGEAEEVMLRYVRAHPFYSPGIAWTLGYPGDRREPRAVARWLVASFGMFAVVRSAER